MKESCERLSELPARPTITRLFGTSYFHMSTSDGGDLWLTPWGVAWLEHLDPSTWYDNEKYLTRGTRLGFSTGNVFKIDSNRGRSSFSFVVKFSRLAQSIVAAGLNQSGPNPITSFRSPFEEIGQLTALRSRSEWKHSLFTKRPLGVFSPGKRFPQWAFDRVSHEFSRAAIRLEIEQRRSRNRLPIKLEPDRDYITLFSWVKGYNLEELVQRGCISHSEMIELNREAQTRLAELGFGVADHKPNHVIVRLDRCGAPRRRRGQLVFALADFELLEELPGS